MKQIIAQFHQLSPNRQKDIVQILKEITTVSDENLLTREQTAAYLGISATSLDRFIRAGKITPIKLSGKTTRFTKEMLDKFIN